MDYKTILNIILDEYKRILGKDMTGMYVHGSIAFGCFNRHKSDIDFIVVTKISPTQRQKKQMIGVLLDIDKVCPPNGVEMSVVLEKHCRNFIYPTPYELHFSNTHKERCRADVKRYCEEMKGTDKDLAAHFMVIKKVGITLWGEEISSLFGQVPKEYYLDSIESDIKEAKKEVLKNSVYITLNLCRVLAYVKEGLIISKEQGGIWGLEHIDKRYKDVIKTSLKSYRMDENFVIDKSLTMEFADYMLKEIFEHCK